MAIVQNTFNGGLNQDISDFLRKNDTLRGAKNIRIIDLDSSTYAVTLVDGTEESFTLSTGFTPLASREYDNILYIVSINGNEIEIGSYPSPDYTDSASKNYYTYRAFNNLIDGIGGAGAFKTTEFKYEADAFLDLVIQPEYDDSINLIIVSKGVPMRIINSKFKRDKNNNYVELDNRSSTANSNTYTSASLDKETSLILASDKILKIDYDSIEDGGQLTYGNYVYLFKYMTEDFNTTDIVGQSSICSVFSGDNINNVKGGLQNDQANKLVKLKLTNVDTDFKYLKVYFKYSSGTRDAQYDAVFELTVPTPISSNEITFIHSGYEDTIEVEESIINLDFSIIDSATTGEAIGGFLMLGDIVEREYDYEDFKAIAAQVVTSEVIGSHFEYTLLYNDPKHIYQTLSYFGGETYPFGMIFVLPDGKLTPPFPVTGFDMLSSATDKTNSLGLFRFSNSNTKPIFKREFVGTLPLPMVKPKSIKFDLSKIPNAQLTNVKSKSLGFFFVRGNRKSDLITQGVLIPTLRVPPISNLIGANFGLKPTYYKKAGNDESAYRFIPCIDNLVEAHKRAAWNSGRDDYYVVDDRNQLKDGYMPIFVNDMQEQYVEGGKTATDAINNYSELHWAFIPGDSLLNNPELISQLNGRTGINLVQLGRIMSKVEGKVTPLWVDDENSETPSISVGSHYIPYDFEGFVNNSNSIESIDSIPEATFASGSNFISKFEASLFFFGLGGNLDKSHNFDISQEYNNYFGITLKSKLANYGSKGTNSPIGGNSRRTYNIEDHHTTGYIQESSGLSYNNYNKVIPASFLVNLYQGAQRDDITTLYPTLTGVIYRQIGNRFTWDDLPTSKTHQLFGGDCYITKVTRKLNQSGYPNPITPFDRRNIDAGISISWWQESKYNLHLRVPYRFDANELTDRSFYPFEGGGNYEKFRQYRLPETVEGNKGYSVTTLPKSFIPISDLAPVIKSSFFSRIHHSARHIPNAFANGYRIFEGFNFKDYDTAMGAITNILNHRGNMVVIFEHGIGVTSIEQRVQTGEDFAGQIFVKPSDILPPTLQFYSRNIGCQHPLSIIQTPSSIYGLDVDKHKIWQINESLKIITEDGLSSFMAKATFKNPRSGHDFEFNEVLFTTDDWTLCFKEGLEKFTSFYTFKPIHYATRSDEFYSFMNDRFHRHNATVKTIYGNIEESYVEFTINEGVSGAKVHDYINIISNEVEPTKIEFFTYADKSYNDDVIETTKVQQYTKVEQELDFFTDEDKIRYRDKKFVVQIPNAEIYNKKDETDEWEKDGRIRNKYLIVRLTYETEDYLHLIAILTSIRQSIS